MSIKPTGGNRLPTEQYRPGMMVRYGYQAAEKFLTLPQQVEGFLQKRQFTQGTQPSLWKSAYNHVIRVAGYFGKLVTDFDFRASHYLELPGKLSKLGKYLISEPPMGTLVVIMMLFNIPSRMQRAIERDPTGREMWDVMRRDVTGITILLFALGPLVTHLSRFMQKQSGIRLVKEANGPLGKSFERFTYRQFKRNYTLTNAKILEALVRDEGNHTGLISAAQKLSDGSLSKNGYGQHLKQGIEAFQQALASLVKAVKDKQELQVAGLAEKAYGLLHQMDALREEAISATAKGSNAHIARLAKALPKFSEFISRYAMNRRLMVDIFSLLLCVVGIGWFPVWFNDFWNRKRHRERIAHLQHHALEKPAVPVKPQIRQVSGLQSPTIPAYAFPSILPGILPGFQYNGGSSWKTPAQGIWNPTPTPYQPPRSSFPA